MSQCTASLIKKITEILDVESKLMAGGGCSAGGAGGGPWEVLGWGCR